MDIDDTKHRSSEFREQQVTLGFQGQRRNSQLRDFSELQSLCHSLISLLNTYNAVIDEESPYFDHIDSTESIMREIFNNCGPPLRKDQDDDSAFSISDILMEVSKDELELHDDGDYRCHVKGHVICLSENQRKVVFDVFPLFFKRTLSLEGMRQESTANKVACQLFQTHCEMHLKQGKQAYIQWHCCDTG